ncbi:MAG: TorF family putative porin [Gammaproteobacteria bacterium]
MMRAYPLGLIATLAGMSCAISAHAEQPANMLTGYVTLMSNYIGRGLAQSVGNPSAQAELDYNPSDGLYAGLDGTSINWIDQVYPGDSVSLELDGYAGYRKTDGDWTLKGGVLRLQFPGRYVPQTPPVARPDTTELFGFVGWRALSAKLNYSITNAFGTPDSRSSWYLDLSATAPLNESWSLGAHIGRKQSRGHDPVTGLANTRTSYTDYRLTVTRAFAEHTSIALAYTWTNANPALYTLNGYNVGGRHLAITLEKDF